MKIQSYANLNSRGRTSLANITGRKKKKKPESYFAFMADVSDKDAGLSLVFGTGIAAVRSIKNFKSNFVNSSLRHVGGIIVALFAVRNVQYAALKYRQNKK